MEACDDLFLLTTLPTPNVSVFTPRQAIEQLFGHQLGVLQVGSYTKYQELVQTPLI